MNAVRLPSIWLDLRPGDRVFSKRPYHTLERMQGSAAQVGVIVTFEPAPGGYWVLCADCPPDPGKGSGGPFSFEADA